MVEKTVEQLVAELEDRDRLRAKARSSACDLLKAKLLTVSLRPWA